MKKNEPLTSFPKSRIHILLLEGINPSAINEFKKADYTHIETEEKALNENELAERIRHVHILGIRSKTNITKKIIANAEKLIGIGCFCIGTDQVDLDAATEAGITVFNSPYSNTRSVAELVLADIIMLIRRIPERNEAAHRGEWLKDAKGSHELRGKTLGIVGYGHIGSQVSVLAEALGMRVIFYDIEPKLPLGNAQAVDSLTKLLKESDVVTLHVPETPQTFNMISRARIRQMREGSILINLSRGTVVDLEALRDAIVSGHIKGAAIDVFPSEPKSKQEKFVSPLQHLPNVILTPHIGGSTEEAQENIGFDVSRKLISLLDTGATVGSHTVPPLSLPVQQNTHRLLHIHKNQPGVLSEINGICSSLNVNIVGQYLKTNEKIGYVVLDVEKTASKKAFEEMKKVKHTIKTRILY
ncbi:MAG TPA: phosphoglycerate dehydrogenase [Chitinophagales bacterium]|nr:phosphoglycerate dehydrogenase [Chitinophagales bacterium]